MNKTKVINIKNKNTNEPYVYIGRKNNTNQHFGNPFLIGINGNREEVIRKFELWITKKDYLDIEPERREWILKNLHLLKGKTLGYFCAPLMCHGDIYVKLWDIDNEWN